MAVFIAKIFSSSAMALFLMVAPSLAKPKIAVGSKNFTENYFLAELASQKLERKGYEVKRRFGFANTLLAYQALASGEIDLYPDYSGTIKELFGDKLDPNLVFLSGFGFSNQYALAVTQEFGKEKGLRRISDLRGQPLKGAFSFEFLERSDGLQSLKRYYDLPDLIGLGMNHDLVYLALQKREIDVIEVYTTDSKIKSMNLLLLEDDEKFFPEYRSGILARKTGPLDLDDVRELMAESQITEDQMAEINGAIERGDKSLELAVKEFLDGESQTQPETFGFVKRYRLWTLLGEHLFVTFVAIGAALLLSFPLGVVLRNFPTVAQPLVAISGLLQTVPSLALLFFMVPLFGIGKTPAVAALFLYSILPILRNTLVALRQVQAKHIEVASAIGLSPWQVLLWVELPLSMPTIFAGIKTASVIAVGTATIAAFIGAGGLGVLIVRGLSLNDPILIVLGAVLSALLAIGFEVVFFGLERFFQRRKIF